MLLLLFVDQLEELYTLEHSPDIRRAICQAADDSEGPIRVLFTVREDFLGHLADSHSAREALSRITVLRAHGQKALEDIVRKPIELAGYSYEDEGLPEEILDAVRDAPASLPILQFACRQLWNQRIFSFIRGNWLSKVLFSPDGRFFISTHGDEKLRVWNAQNWEIEQLIEEPGKQIEDATISADGELLAYGGSDGAIVVRDFETKKIRAQLFDNTTYIHSLSFSSNGNYLAASTHDGKVLVWDTETWSLHREFHHAKASVWSVSFLPQVLALRSGCLTLSQDTVTLTKATGEAIPLAKQATAMSRQDDSVLVLQGDTVRILDPDGFHKSKGSFRVGCSAPTATDVRWCGLRSTSTPDSVASNRKYEAVRQAARVSPLP